MAAAGPVWDRAWPSGQGCGETDVTRVASWWHADGDLGRDIECLTDMTRSRLAGFTGYRSTLTSLLDLFEQLEPESGIVRLPATSGSRQA